MLQSTELIDYGSGQSEVRIDLRPVEAFLETPALKIQMIGAGNVGGGRPVTWCGRDRESILRNGPLPHKGTEVGASCFERTHGFR